MEIFKPVGAAGTAPRRITPPEERGMPTVRSVEMAPPPWGVCSRSVVYISFSDGSQICVVFDLEERSRLRGKLRKKAKETAKSYLREFYKGEPVHQVIDLDGNVVSALPPAPDAE